MPKLNTNKLFIIEKSLKMENGYVLDFSDSSFGRFVSDCIDLDIHSQKYKSIGTSKANKLRELIRLEDVDTVSLLLTELLEYKKLHYSLEIDIEDFDNKLESFIQEIKPQVITKEKNNKSVDDFWSLIHPEIVKTCRSLFQNGHYTNSIIDGCILIESKVKKSTKLKET